MRKVVTSACVMMVVAGCVFGARAEEDRSLGVDVEASFVTNYMWRGYDLLSENAAFQPSVTLDLFGTGFSVNVWGSFALSAGFEDLDELDYTVAYDGTLFEDAVYAVDYTATYVYFDFPNIASEITDTHELGLGVSMPNLLPIGPSYLVPSFTTYYLWEVHSEGPGEGWFNILGLSYDVPMPALLPGQDEQFISLAGDLTHNDGWLGSDSGISHATAGISTTFEFMDISVTPSYAYQWSYEDTVNPTDEQWAGIAVGYSF